MESVNEICAALGRKEMQDRLGVGRGALTSAVRAGQFPAAWYRVVTEMAAERGLTISDDLFHWREAS